MLDFQTAFEQILDAGDTGWRASLLVQLCKDFDLRDPEHRDAVAQIAQWVRSENGHVRQEVVFALCLFRPVPGYEWVAIEGWKAAPAAGIHWYASAIESAFTRPDQVSPAVLQAISTTLNRKPPDRSDYNDDFSYAEALADHQLVVAEATRAMTHLQRLRATTAPA